MSTSCPICNSQNLKSCFIHQKWRIPCLRCTECTHVFSSKHVAEKEDNFTTNRQRADFYLQSIVPLNPSVVMDIGTPADFYILNSVHTKLPQTQLFALDLYEKKHPPHVTMLKDFPESPTDLTTAFHVLEHVQELKPFIQSLVQSSRHFIIEVPDCGPNRQMIRSSTKPHTHFFNATSLKRLLEPHAPDVQVAVRRGTGIPLNMTSLMAYSLPKGLSIEADSRSLTNFISRLRLSQYLLQPLKKSHRHIITT